MTLRSQLVACDRGPAPLVQIASPVNETYLWSAAYSFDDFAGAQEQRRLAQVVARDVGQAFKGL